VVFEQRLEWPNPKISSRISRERRSRSVKLRGTTSFVDGVANEDENFVRGGIAVGFAEFFEIETIEDFAVQVGFTCWYSLCSKVWRFAIKV